MKKFYIITNLLKDKTLETTYRIKNYIEEHGGECVLATPERILPEGTECVLVLGGDGTLIRAARDMHAYDVPLLGINMGTLGYLTEVELSHVEEALDQLLDGETQVEKRMMLYAQVERRGRVIFSGEALNDAVISKSGIMKMVHLNLNIDNCFVNEYYADGIILSTPTGSTAYSLSAGGPVVVPSIDCMVVNPVCAHTVTSRPMVISSESMVKITVDRYHFEDVILSLDGGRGFRLKDKDVINIKKSENYVKLIRFENRSFYDILRTKLSERN